MALGVAVVNRTAPAPNGVGINTGTAFVVGLTDQGPSTSSTQCNSLADYVRTYGGSSSTNTLYDQVDVFFREGGLSCYVSRLVGPAVASASINLVDSAAKNVLAITADYPGAYANGYLVTVTSGTAGTLTANTTSTSPNLANVSSFANLAVGATVTGTGIPPNTTVVSVNTGANSAVLSANATATGTGVTVTVPTFILNVTDASANVLAGPSPALSTQAAAIAWGNAVPYIGITAPALTPGIDIPSNVANSPLAGGNDDRGNATTTQYTNALSNHLSNYGPGQVLVPGNATSAVWVAMFNHAYNNNRFAVADIGTASAASLVSSLGSFATTNSVIASSGMFVSNNALVPGVSVARSVPWSVIQAAKCAVADVSGNPALAACGASYKTSYVISIDSEFNDTDRLTLFGVGINAPKNIHSVPCLYGFQSPVSPLVDPIYCQANHARLRMAMTANAKAIGQNYLFQLIDGKGVVFSAFQNDIVGLLSGLYNAGALYGGPGDPAFSVNVSSSVNTPTTIAAGEIHALVQVRMSPYAQYVEIDLVSVQITQAVS